MTRTNPDNASILDINRRWQRVRQAVNDHYGIERYPFAADRILNDARHRGVPGAPPSQAFEHFWTEAHTASAVALCERHRDAHPEAAPVAPARVRRHYNRRIDEAAIVGFADAAAEQDLTLEHVIAVAVHDLLSRPGPLAEDVLDMLVHLMREVEHHGNVADPTTVPDPAPGAIVEMPDPAAPWNYVPGRPPDTAPASDAALADWLDAGLPARSEPDDEDDDDEIDLDDILDPVPPHLLDWYRFCDDLAEHYAWHAYPSAEHRILRAAQGPEARGLPDKLDPKLWSVDQTAAARDCCERYRRRRPGALPPFPERSLRYYNALAKPTQIAAFAVACENLALNPEDALVLAVFGLCLADAPGTPEVLETLAMVILDIEIHGNVLDPAIVPESPAAVQ